jgi:Phage tail sheath protein subtilisin-like domain/Phage tail sheath C-terminal domain
MAFQVSPGVNVSEIDLTTVIPSVSTSTGAVAGPFLWGPVDVVRQVSDETQLVSVFGKPNTATYGTFFTAANFLAYANDLRVVRAANSSTYTAYAGANTADTAYDGESIQIGNEDDYELNHFSALGNTAFAARYPGDLGNSLKVSVWANTTVAMSTWMYGSLFDKAPATSNFVATNFKSNANDELHIVVVDEDGKFTGTPNTVLERFSNLSKSTNAKDDSGQSLYYKDYLLRNSKYVYWTGQPLDVSGNDDTWDVAANSTYTFPEMASTSNSFSLVGGTYIAPTNAEIIAAYDKLKNAETVDISLVMTANHDQTVALDVINNLADARKDCVAFVSPALANVQAADATTAVVNYRKNALANVAKSYAVMDGNWKYQYDKYNDAYRWVPLNGDIAGLCARTDTDRDPWFSPAGVTRGQIKNVIKLAWNPTKANRDELYKNDVNPVVSFAGEGTILYGDKTLLGRPSAFDRINVRRLFITLEKSISRAARSSLFEFNDEFTRAQFVNLVEPFLRLVQGRRGIYDYRVVCDETNNTPEVIDSNSFVGDIYVKPAKSINFIQLNFVAVRTGVSFEEVVGRF